jgi:hypothetical protein
MFFIVAAVAAIVGLALYDPILNDSRYIVDGSADDTQVLLGALFELILAMPARQGTRPPRSSPPARRWLRSMIGRSCSDPASQ